MKGGREVVGEDGKSRVQIVREWERIKGYRKKREKKTNKERKTKNTENRERKSYLWNYGNYFSVWKRNTVPIFLYL